MTQLGAHLSVAGGYDKGLQKIVAIGGNCLQIFSTSPRGWSFAQPSQETITQFVELKKRLSINPVYFHASYLVNLADNSSVGHLSKEALISELNLAAQMNVTGSVIHLGSF